MTRAAVLLVFLLLASLGFGQAADSSGSFYDRTIKVEAPNGVLRLNLSGQIYQVGPFDNKTILDAISWNPAARDEFSQAFDHRKVAAVWGLFGAGLSLAALGVRIYTYTQPMNQGGYDAADWCALGLSAASAITILIAAPYQLKGDEELYGAVNRYNKDVLER